MTDTKITPVGGIYSLGGARDVDLTGINPTYYDVFLTDKDLADARAKYPKFDWFVCFCVKDKSGGYAEIAYTFEFDRPASGTLYYFFNGAAHSITYTNAPDKAGKKRAKATLTVGDPPVGMG